MKPNRLINEKSPYLLQHAYNPVDWYPWCEEAFERAKKEDKPIFLSIGYSTCHWCHVMEKESFEDEEIAKILNENFISIKVDREERPDIDKIYMDICLMLNGHGGWPLTVIMTPDKEPFFVGTYFPKESRYNRAGLKDILLGVINYWKNNREDLLNRAKKVVEYIQNENKPSKENISPEVIDRGYNELKNRFDKNYGGFSSKPKFPTPHNIIFLLKYYKRKNDDYALYMAEQTLKKMRLGGIFDHIGYGFHRYSTDNMWLLPHFEKMLYDQAMLIIAYSQAYQITKNPFYKKVAEEIIEYITRDMYDRENGGFYSAEDADSEGKEGKFYLWTIEEIKNLLKDDADLFIKIFNIEEEGNFYEEATGRKTGENIIYLKKDIPELSVELKIDKDILSEKIEKWRKILFEEREKRVHPLKDDKILTDWNGLIIAALSIAGKAFENDSYINYAKSSADFILNKMYKDGRLLHRYRENEAAIDANLDDYSYFIFGLLELYEATLEDKYLENTINLTQKMIELFYDEENGGFFFTPKDREILLTRAKEVYDGAIPSGNSVALYDLIKIQKITADLELEEKIYKTVQYFASDIKRLPSYHTFFLFALDYLFYGGYEIVITGDKQKALEVAKNINKEYIPNKVLFYLSDYVRKIAPYTENMESDEKDINIYICKDFSCNMPVKNTEDALKLLNRG
ncbi:thioredoxin domain-containing protein [Venenivibrio stagnispumantis]|uniref:Spermatogenesis-associated protein 20-like TRX domain-containing protein n=1 Tax=Venenivibrio stagnispumantis TaxID=407998 RepID=A0AA46AEK5_9AQUI|nr:thioredoxin domain-containing protein [Venenivibrio stagnispumantis]MCW4572873.1 thioredoxin domain-containing protein [Venenivibrio stagnispumantis]SMP13002.1 hypothetical protein SAMN06264868_11027 [Venenivibrio stagnispumantis]